MFGDRRRGACNPDRISLMQAESTKEAMESLAGDLSSRDVEVSEDTETTAGNEESQCTPPSQAHGLVGAAAVSISYQSRRFGTSEMAQGRAIGGSRKPFSSLPEQGDLIEPWRNMVATFQAQVAPIRGSPDPGEIAGEPVISFGRRNARMPNPVNGNSISLKG